MGVINTEEIAGYRVGEKVFCSECVPKEDADSAKQGDIITEAEADSEERSYFCDDCGERL